MKRFGILFCFFLLFLWGCGTSNQNGSIPDSSETTLTGYILEVGDRVLFNEKVTKEDFDTKTEQEIHDEFYFSSIFLSIGAVDSSTVSKLEAGQKVMVVISGGIAESAPAQATANKIEIIEE